MVIKSSARYRIKWTSDAVSCYSLDEMKLIDINVLDKGSSSLLKDKEYHLFYLLQGNAVLKVRQKAFPLDANDVLAINPEEEYQTDIKGICVDLRISHSRVLQLLGYQRRIVICNSYRNHNENTRKLCKTISMLLKNHYDPQSSPILYEQYALQLVYELFASFSNNVFSNTEDHRKEDIASYIEANFSNDLTLEEIADVFGLTPQYFSKYFKSVFGTSFLKYLNEVRLENARIGLIHSDEAMLRIAINNGFPNAASFIREFRKHYDQTPGEYRAKIRKEEDKEGNTDLLELLDPFEMTEKGNEIEVFIDASEKGEVLDSYWTRILNVGSFRTMMKNRMMEQVAFLHDSLKFSKARLIIDTYKKDGKHLYAIADSVIEFFVRNQMDIIVVIDLRTIEEEEHFLSYLREQCLRFSNRFGMSIVRHTLFEIRYNSSYDSQKLKRYRSFYKKVQAILVETSFDGDIIGPGVLVDESGENFRMFVRANPQIDTYTITSAPFALAKKGDEVFINRLTDSSYVLEQYKRAKKVLEEEGKDEQKLLLVEWKDRLNDIDVLNETPYMGARIIKNVLEGYGIFSSLSLDMPLDLMFEEENHGMMFRLLPGILTENGIRKPSYHALKLLDQQDRFLIRCDSDYLISKSSEDGYYQILCHNCKKLGFRYYMNDTLEKMESYSSDLFEDDSLKTMRFHFRNLKEGAYLIKQRTVSDEKGCSFTRFIQMDYKDDSFIGLGEKDYLEACSVIPISGRRLMVSKDGILDFSVTLQMNEFCHIHIIRARN